MKVRDLIAYLNELDPNTEVILQKDSEGNGYSPCSGVDTQAVYVPENTWSGTVYDTRWTADDAMMSHSEWEEILNMPRCIVLYPVN